jgi:ankyrin repeat protein
MANLRFDRFVILPRWKPAAVTFVWLLLAGWVLPPPASAADTNGGLRLVAVSGGREFDAFQVHGRVITAATPEGLVPLEGRVEWRIEGDLGANSDRIDFQPHYQLQRRAMAFLPEEPGQRFQAVVDGPGNLGKSPRAFDPDQLESAVMVAVWLVEQRPVKVLAVGLPDAAEQKGRSLAAIWMTLRDAETAGAPVLLVWSKGRFLPATPSFSNPGAQRALAAMFLGSDGDLAREIDQPGIAEATGMGGITLLHAAAGGGFERAQALLLEHGGRRDVQDNASATPLVRAMQLGRKATATRLIDAGALKSGPDVGAVEVLADLYAQTGTTDLAVGLANSFQGWGRWKLALPTLAEVAARTGDLEALRLLVAKGAGGLLPRVSPATFLHRVAQDDSATVEFLLANKYNARADQQGTTGLHVAARFDAGGSAALLLRAGARSGSVDRGNSTPLMIAAREGSLTVARQLLAARADVRTSDAEGRTALHRAVLAGDVEMVRLLVAAKARLADRDQQGRTPLALALVRHDRTMVETLVAAGARLARADADDEAAIEGVITLDRPDLVAQLRTAGWSPDTLLPGGWPAATVAGLHGASRLAALLPAGRPAPVIVPAGAPLEQAPRLLHWEPVSGGSTGGRPRQFLVQAVIDAEGRVRFPRLAEPADDAEAARVVATVMDWRFAPAIRAGKPVNLEVRLPLSLQPIAAGVLEPDEVDRPAAYQSDEPRASPTTVGLESTFQVERRIDQYGNARYSLWNTPTDEFMDAVASLDCLVSVIVEVDGSAGPVFVPGFYLGQSKQIDLAAAGFRFLPALRDGRPVRSRLTLRLVRPTSPLSSAPLEFIDANIGRNQERVQELVRQAPADAAAAQNAQLIQQIQQQFGQGR